MTRVRILTLTFESTILDTTVKVRVYHTVVQNGQVQEIRVRRAYQKEGLRRSPNDDGRRAAVTVMAASGAVCPPSTLFFS